MVAVDVVVVVDKVVDEAVTLVAAIVVVVVEVVDEAETIAAEVVVVKLLLDDVGSRLIFGP